MRWDASGHIEGGSREDYRCARAPGLPQELCWQRAQESALLEWPFLHYLIPTWYRRQQLVPYIARRAHVRKEDFSKENRSQSQVDEIE